MRCFKHILLNLWRLWCCWKQRSIKKNPYRVIGLRSTDSQPGEWKQALVLIRIRKNKFMIGYFDDGKDYVQKNATEQNTKDILQKMREELQVRTMSQADVTMTSGIQFMDPRYRFCNKFSSFYG